MKVYVAYFATGDRGDVWCDIKGVFTKKEDAEKFDFIEVELDGECDIALINP